MSADGVYIVERFGYHKITWPTQNVFVDVAGNKAKICTFFGF
jgi:hypothetical protein